MKCEVTHGGEVFEIEIQEDESLLEAAIKAGAEPPYSCLEGICGTCEAKLLKGQAITPEGVVSEGIIRTCMSRPKSDISITYDIE